MYARVLRVNRVDFILHGSLDLLSNFDELLSSVVFDTNVEGGSVDNGIDHASPSYVGANDANPGYFDFKVQCKNERGDVVKGHTLTLARLAFSSYCYQPCCCVQC